MNSVRTFAISSPHTWHAPRLVFITADSHHAKMTGVQWVFERIWCLLWITKLCTKPRTIPLRVFLWSVWIREAPWRATAPDTLQRACTGLHRLPRFTGIENTFRRIQSQTPPNISYLCTAIDHCHLLTPHSYLFATEPEWNMKASRKGRGYPIRNVPVMLPRQKDLRD